MARFPSREWALSFCEELNKNPRYKASAQGWRWPILFKISDLPGNPGFILDLYDGECRGVEWFDNSEGASAPFVISATLDNWREVISGRVNPLTAFMRRKLILEKGSMQALMRYPMAAMEMVRSAQNVGLQ